MREDWHRDPWGWPELDWVVREQPGIAYERLASTGARRVAKIDVAKENFGVRPAMILDPVDRLIYQALVDRISRSLIGDMNSLAYGWRLPPASPEPGKYARNDHQHENFRSALTGLSNTHPAALRTDVSSFFASIPVDRLVERIYQRSGRSAVSERLAGMLMSWETVDGRSGIPQRSLASCVLANMYMRDVDSVLAEYAPPPSDAARTWGQHERAVRWMDDIWLFGDDAGGLRSAQVELQRRMADLGLLMNLGKTEVLEGWADIDSAVRRIQHSAVEADLAGARTLGPLNDLITTLTSSPETSNRTSIKFATRRMRDLQNYSRVQDFIDVAKRMPHASDGLARLFRESEAWRDLGPWFADYVASGFAAIDWSIAEFARSFPSSDTPPHEVKAFVGEQLHDPRSIAVASLAAERMSSWDRDTCRSATRERRGSASHPMERRALALAALAAGEGAPVIRQMLGEFEENAVTLAMLEARSFRPVRVKADFAGSL